MTEQPTRPVRPVDVAFWRAVLAALAATLVADLGPRSWSAPLFLAAAVVVAVAGALFVASLRPPRR